MSYMPYARTIENVRTKCFIFGEALRIRFKKFKIAITVRKFSKFFQGSMPPDHPRAFVSQSTLTLFCRKKSCAPKKDVEILALPLSKSLATPLAFTFVELLFFSLKTDEDPKKKGLHVRRDTVLFSYSYRVKIKKKGLHFC